MEDVNCYICNSQAEQYPRLEDKTDLNCPYCGKYSLTGSFNIESCFTDRTNFYKVSSWIREQNNLFQNNPIIDYERFEEILNIRDKKIKEKFDLMMHYLSDIDVNVYLNKNILIKCWIKDENEFLKLYQKALDERLLDGKFSGTINGFTYPSFHGLTFDGLEYIENLDSPNQSSKNIFVAFNFQDELNDIFNVHLNKAIEDNGFNYVVVNQDNVEHNKSINDEIIVKLKSSRIVIADFTHHRNSVYFEAGFAMGMNIPIIWTCQDGHDKELSFDTRQFPHIIWKDKDDLVKQVIDRIRVIL
ncbi:MAG: hypothetical protein GQ474_03970 [Sulfurimonas sp.]|nr:hypothetical protein [Sulfurimonas sp.]